MLIVVFFASLLPNFVNASLASDCTVQSESRIASKSLLIPSIVGSVSIITTSNFHALDFTSRSGSFNALMTTFICPIGTTFGSIFVNTRYAVTLTDFLESCNNCMKTSAN